MPLMVMPFPSCCGADILTGFHMPIGPAAAGTVQFDPATGGYNYPPPCQTEDEAVEYLTTLIDDKKASYPQRIYFAILTEAQLESEFKTQTMRISAGKPAGLHPVKSVGPKGAWARILEKTGFIHVCASYNSAHREQNGGKGTLLHTFILVTGAKPAEGKTGSWQGLTMRPQLEGPAPVEKAAVVPVPVKRIVKKKAAARKASEPAPYDPFRRLGGMKGDDAEF